MRMYLLDRKQRVRRWLKDNDFIEAEMTEEINAANQITFSLPLKERIANNIYYVAIPTPHSKQKYLLFKLLSERVQNDRIEYQGIEEAYDELKQYGYIKDIRPNDRTAEEMLKMVLEPTRWTLGNVPETNHQSTNFYYISYLEALQKIVGLFNIELTFEVAIDPKSNKITRRQVNVYTEQGQRTGKRFEYGSNLLTVQQEQDSQELITALVGRGKGELVSEGHDDTPDGYGRRITFADVVWTKKDGHPVDKPAGQEYLVDPEATALYGFSDGNPRIGLTVFEDIEDPVELINATWRALQSLKRPKVSFKADVTDVGQLGLGDTVAIIRHDLKIEYFTRVYKVKHNLLNENNNQIELGDDFSGHSITSSIIKVDEIANEARETAGHAAIAANGKNNNYYSSVQPLAPVEGDIWYKDLGNGETDMYQYHNGGWVFIQSTRDLHVVENQVKEAQDGLNQAKADIINNKQKADADIENLNKSIEVNKKVADESLKKLNDSVTNLQGQYDNNVVPNLNKVMADASDALQKYITAQSSIADLTKRAQDQGKDIADVTNTVKGLNINYANLAGDVNSTKVDVKGLQTTVGTANGDIAQLKLDAQNLQTMLAGKVDNTTYTNFVNLTNQALNARLTASDLNGYAKTADVQATANGLRVDLNSVTDRMNNLKVGTSNLLHHSDTFEGWHKGASVSVSSNKYLNGNIAVLKNTGSGGTALDAELDGPYDNQPISWAVYAKADNAGDKLHTELWGGGGFADQPLTTEWQVYKFTGQRDARDRDHSFYLWGCQGNKGNIYVALPFAVVGNTIGTWGPNASDINHDLNELSARVNVTSQQFSSYYTKSETDTKADVAKNDAVNAIKSDGNWQGLSNILTNSGFLQTADGFLQKVQQTTIPMFSGGGVNLVSGTTEDIVVDDTGNTGTQGWCFKAIPINADLKVGDKITVSVENVDLTGNGDLSKWGATLYSTDISEMRANNYEVNAGKNAKVTIVVTSLNDVNKQTALLIYSGRISDTQGKKAIFHHLKVERGEIDTPYSPSPSDNVTQIAFSELSQSLEGLRSTVSGNYGQLQNTINQTNQATRNEIIDKVAGLQNQITTTANGLNAKIGAIQVGGRNLLIDTSENEISGKAYNFADYQISGGLQPNKTYTLSGWARVDQDSLNHHQNVFIDAYSDDWSWSINLNINSSLTAQYNKLTFTTPSGKQFHPYVTVYLTHPDGGTNENNNDATSGMAFIKKLKLEEGNIATDYTHAPEDTEKSFTEVNAAINGLRSTVSNNYGQLQSLNTQTATAIRNEVTDKVNGLQGQITTQANNINLMLGTAGDLSNICRNPTFDNHDGWTDSVHVESNWPEIPTKNCGVLFTRDGYYGKSFTVVPGDRYYTSVFANNQNDVDFVLGLYFKMKDGSDQWLGGSQIGARECRQALGSITVPDNAVTAQIWASIQKFDNFGFTRFTNVIVKKNDTLAQINMSAGTTLIQNDKIYMDASSTIFSGNAFIPSAAITSLNADKITTGTLNAANVNIINLNANNITTGTINGQNLKIDLNTGNVEFQHGRIHNFSNTVDINLDQNYISTANYNTRALLKNGELQLTQPSIFDTNGNWYFRLFNGGGAGDAWAGASLIGRDSVTVANEANAEGATGFTSNPIGTATFSGLFTGRGTNNWMPTVLGGAERGVFIKGGKDMSVIHNMYDPNDGGVFVTGSPFISVGVDGPNNNWWGNRIVIDGEYLHVPTAWRHTTGGAPNLVVANDGAIVRSTSASKYKTEIHRDYSSDYGDRLLSLPTATWVDKGQKKRYQAGKRHIKPSKYFGMIAEDLADAGLDLLVSRNSQTHEIEGIQYERIGPALIPVIRKLKKKVQQLEEKLNEQ